MKPIQLGFIESGTGKHQSNTVYSVCGVCPCISTLIDGGTQQIKVLVVEDRAKILGNIYGDNFGCSFAGNVYDKDYLAPTLMNMQGGGRQPLIVTASESKNDSVGGVQTY